MEEKVQQHPCISFCFRLVKMVLKRTKCCKQPSENPVKVDQCGDAGELVHDFKLVATCKQTKAQEKNGQD